MYVCMYILPQFEGGAGMWVWLMCCVYLCIPYLSWFTDRPLTVCISLFTVCSTFKRDVGQIAY